MNKKEIRRQFRIAVFERDNYTCQGCGKTLPAESLDAHHIINRTDIKSQGYVPANGITLCKPVCHLKAEKYHITGGKEWEEGFHPNDLFKKIGSSKEQAIEDANEINL